MSNEAIHVHRFGNPDAPPLVLVHGLTDDGTNWPDAVFRWAFHWDIHAVDLRGHGQSPRFAEDDVSASHLIWVDDLRDVVAALGAPIIVGHSLGGITTLRLVIQHPGLARAVVLEDPARPSPGTGADPEFVAQQKEFVARFPEQTASEIERMKRETPWSEAEIHAWAESKARVDPLMIEQGLFLGDPAWESLFQTLEVPTLLILPEDGGMGPDVAGYDNPLVRRVVVPGAGHCVRRDRPDDYYSAVEEFMAQHRPSIGD